MRHSSSGKANGGSSRRRETDLGRELFIGLEYHDGMKNSHSPLMARLGLAQAGSGFIVRRYHGLESGELGKLVRTSKGPI